MSAQRLSASRIISVAYQRDDLRQLFRLVLNAFRHHGLYRPAPRDTPQAGQVVLNAFRHHGLYRPAVDWIENKNIPIQVLNAFRHHGLYRLNPNVWTPLYRKCSTPFGITDYIGRTRPLTHEDVAMCSTPFGITDYIGPLRERPRLGVHVVLNAFRHHGLYRPRCWPAPGSGRACAQRLSASRIISVGWTHSRLASTTSAQRLSASRIISERLHKWL